MEMFGAWAHPVQASTLVEQGYVRCMGTPKNLNPEPLFKCSSPKHTAQDKARLLSALDRSYSNFVENIQNTAFHFARAFHKVFGMNVPCQILSFLGRNTLFLWVKVGIGLGSYENNRHFTPEERFDFRDPEVSDAFEGVPVVYGVADDKNLAVLVAKTSQFCVLMLQK